VFFLIKFFEQVKEDEKRGAYSRYERAEKCIQNFSLKMRRERGT
jgi:hypothetical protein